MTDAERALWRRLSRRQIDGARFRRQHPIDRYIVDFVCLSAKLVVELDGGQHAEQAEADADAERTRWRAGRGYRVVRFWNHDVLSQPDAVVEEIRRVLNEQSGDPILIFPGEGKTPTCVTRDG